MTVICCFAIFSRSLCSLEPFSFFLVFFSRFFSHFFFQDPSAAVASSTSAGCTPDHLADLIGFVMRCHLEVEELAETVRRQVLTGQVWTATKNLTHYNRSML